MDGQALPPPDPVYTFRPHAGEVVTLRYLKLGMSGVLASGTSTGQLSIWNLDSKRQSWVETCSNPLIHIELLPEQKLISGGLVSRCGIASAVAVKLKCGVWRVRRRSTRFSIANPGFCRVSALYSEDTASHSHVSSNLTSSCIAVSDSNYGKVNVHDVLSHNLTMMLSAKDPKSRGMCMCVEAYCNSSGSGDGYILGGFEDGSILLWDCRNPSAELSALKLFTDPVLCMDFDVPRSSGVCGSPQKVLEVFSLRDSQLDKKYSAELRNEGVADVNIRQDGKIMASGGWDGRIRVFGLKKGKVLAVLNYHSSTVNCVSFAGSSALQEHTNLLACGSKDERISLWKLY